MNKNNFLIISFIMYLGISITANGQNETSFSKQQILDDIDYLKKTLEQTHYNLYAFTNRNEFLENADNIKKTITNDSLNLLEATNAFQKIISRANTGHAEIDFPVQSYIQYAQRDGTLFPIEIALENDNAYIRNNLSNDNQLKVGMQLISINGIDINKIIEKLYLQLSAERKYFKNAKLEFWSFPRLYWQIFGEQKSFKIEVKELDKISEYSIKPISVGDYESRRKGEILNQERKFSLKDGIGYINPGPFSSNADEKIDLYKRFIDSSFNDLKENDIDTLIIDLRNNSGGDNEYSDFLISYIADKPFKWHSKFTLKSSSLLKQHTRKNNDTTTFYSQTILNETNGKIYEYKYEMYQPVDSKKRFAGKVYVLINRQSYSMSAVAAAEIQDYGFAKIVGEETGDFPTLYASQFSYSLPNTGVVVKVPKGYIIRPNGNEDLRGVIPDIEIKDHLLDDEDEILNELLRILKKKH
ncbi:peptidase S41-like protein [Gelidibacter algens]|uniref:Peptidase S41-like protein n=1 Tax=Gelidibacter algens TaxID=49280 RepID=A0A1A7QVY4_9FLAO|nr:S41 family peptidase [Gelidibacter algens]OBX23453.1 peptidase S41 [Gelidibacter algens]RAJ20656.1 peptidase S41-like protein [Gelidibacter algens]